MGTSTQRNATVTAVTEVFWDGVRGGGGWEEEDGEGEDGEGECMMGWDGTEDSGARP